MADTLDDGDRERIIDALYAGRRIDAVKIYRQATATDLTSAKRFIDQLEARLREESPESFSAPARKGCGAPLLIVIVGVLGAGIGFYFAEVAGKRPAGPPPAPQPAIGMPQPPAQQ